MSELTSLPGSELVLKGLEELHAGSVTIGSLLASMGAHRLRTAGLHVPDELEEPEDRLYDLLTQMYGDEAHSRYNAFLRQLFSFERALECASA